MSSDAETNKFVTKINEKSEQLRANGLTRDDQELLKNSRSERISRLDLIWCEELDPEDSSATLWRKSRARQLYREIQDADEHLFLAFVLAISPTECIKKSFGKTMEYLSRLENYEPYRLKLNHAAKKFFESAAAEEGFAGNHRFLNFMNASFPQNAEILDGVFLEDRQDANKIPSGGDPQSPDHSAISHSTLHTVSRSLKRKGAPTDNEYSEHTPCATDSLSLDRPDAIKLRRLLNVASNSDEDARQSSTPSPATTTSCTNTNPLNELQGKLTAISRNSSKNELSATEQEQLVFIKASLPGIATVFDPYISGAVMRFKEQNSLKGAVTMVFPSGGLVDCLMSLQIHQSEVEYLAMALFKVRVKLVGQVQDVCLKDGVTLRPNSEITLKGVLNQAIIDVFGFEIHEAISACRLRERELREGIAATGCVSMILTSKSSEGAIIGLSLGLEEGTQIRKKLYT